MKKMMALVLGTTLVAGGTMVAQAATVASEMTCEVTWGLGILQTIFPFFDAWLHATTCIGF